ncbi:sodium:solute symporter family transporter [Streptomyces sp. NPDC004561]
MHLHIVSSGVLNPIGSDARGAVIIAFLVFIGASMLWLFMLSAGQADDPERLYVTDRSLSPVFNGIAMAGEQISVTTLLTIPGLIALLGYDGFAFAVDGLLAVGVMLLLAQKIRNSGCYTLGGLFSLRAPGAAPHIAGTVVTLVIAVPLLLIQLRAAGISVALLMGLSSAEAQVVCMLMLGCLVACFAAVADLHGTSVIQVVKVPVTLVTLAVITLLALGKFGWNPGNLLSAAADRSVAPDRYFRPGLWAYTTRFGGVERFGIHIVQITGVAVVPQMILRVGASRTGRSARRSLSIAAGLSGVFVFLLIGTGFAAAAVVGSTGIGAVDATGQSSPILVAADLLPDGSAARIALITVVACAAFLAALTTVTSVTFSAAVSVVHGALTRGRPLHTDTKQARAVRPAIVVLCVLALALSAAIYHYPIDFLVLFVINVAASCIFPALIYSFFWRSFNRRGLLWSVYGGLLLCMMLELLSPSISGAPYALFPDVNFNWYPFQSPGLVSVPAAFSLGWLGSITSPGDAQPDFRHVEYRILTGRDVGSTAVGPKQ